MSQRDAGARTAALRCALLACATLAMAAVGAWAGEVVGWPMIRHDAQNTRATTDEVKPPLQTRWWRSPKRVRNDLAPSRSMKGVTHFVGANGLLYGAWQVRWDSLNTSVGILCLRLADGQALWTHRTPGKADVPTLHGDVLYCPWPGGADALDARTGKLLNRLQGESPVQSGCPYTADGDLLFQVCRVSRQEHMAQNTPPPYVPPPRNPPGQRTIAPWKYGWTAEGVHGVYASVQQLRAQHAWPPRPPFRATEWVLLPSPPYPAADYTAASLTEWVFVPYDQPGLPKFLFALTRPRDLGRMDAFSPSEKIIGRRRSSTLPASLWRTDIPYLLPNVWKFNGRPTVGVDDEWAYIQYHGLLFGVERDALMGAGADPGSTTAKPPSWWRDCGAYTTWAGGGHINYRPNEWSSFSPMVSHPVRCTGKALKEPWDDRSPLVGPEAVYLVFVMVDGSGESGIAAFDKRTGRTLWQTDIAQLLPRLPKDLRPSSMLGSMRGYGINLVLADDRLFFCWESWVGALDARSGQLLWAEQLFPRIAPVVTGEVLYTVTYDPRAEAWNLAALDCATGQVLWRCAEVDPGVQFLFACDGTLITQSPRCLRVWEPVGKPDDEPPEAPGEERNG